MHAGQCDLKRIADQRQGARTGEVFDLAQGGGTGNWKDCFFWRRPAWIVKARDPDKSLCRVIEKIDQIMLGEMIGSQSVGIYSAATRISEIWYFIPTAIASSISPAIFSAKKEGDEILYYRRIQQLLRLLSTIAILIAVPMSFLSGDLVTILFGSEYSAAGPILAIHTWAAVFVFMGVGTSSWFIAEGLTYLTFRRTLIGAVMNIMLNFVLIPMYGGIGAAIATVISQAFASFISNAFNLKSRKIFLIQLKSFSIF